MTLESRLRACDVTLCASPPFIQLINQLGDPMAEKVSILDTGGVALITC